MKKILLLLIAVASGFLSLQAQEESRLVISAGQLNNIQLGENMKVVLVSPGLFQNEIKGDMNIFEKLNVSVSNGTMHISARQKLGAGETIYVEVNQLKNLSLGQNTHVDTQGYLRSEEIKVYVQDGSRARLRTTGEVFAYSLDNLEFSIKKTPVRLN